MSSGSGISPSPSLSRGDENERVTSERNKSPVGAYLCHSAAISAVVNEGISLAILT